MKSLKTNSGASSFFSHPATTIVVSVFGLLMLIGYQDWASPGGLRVGVVSALCGLPITLYQRWELGRRLNRIPSSGSNTAGRLLTEVRAFAASLPPLAYAVGLLVYGPRLHVSVFTAILGALAFTFLCYPQQRAVYDEVSRRLAEADEQLRESSRR